MKSSLYCLMALTTFSLSAMQIDEQSNCGAKEQLPMLMSSYVNEELPSNEAVRSNVSVITNTDSAIIELANFLDEGRVARVLSLDGGGIRGLFSATILQYIEENTDKSIMDLFHLLTGTSTGALLATAISMQDESSPPKAKFKASDIVALYTERGSSLFKKIPWYINIFRGFRSKYYVEQLENIFQEIVGDTKLSSVQIDLMITYHSLTKGKSYLFKSHFARETMEAIANRNSKDINYADSKLRTLTANNMDDRKDYYLRNTLRATSAAPTYFDPLHLSAIGETKSTSVIDGGFFANDPSLCALTEAFKIYPNSDSYLLVSIGTGKCDDIMIADPKSVLAWATLAPNVLMNNAEQMVRHMIKTLGLVYNKKVFYLKVQVGLPKEHASMDNTSPANVQFLRQHALDYVAHTNCPLRQVVELLKKPVADRAEIAKRPNQVLKTNFVDLGNGFKFDGK